MKRFLILALIAAFPGGLAAPAAARSCAAPELRVMTYNIRLDTEADGANRWALRRDLLIAQLRLLRPAIAGFQEVLPGQRADLAAALDGHVMLGGGRDDGKEAGEASPLLIEKLRFRVMSHGMFWLSPTPDRPSRGWDAAYPRVATWAHLVTRGTGRRILTINTHWDHQGVAARAQSATQLHSWISANTLPGEAVLLLGDFNAPLSEGSLRSLLAGRGEATALRDARTLALEPPAGGPATFNGWRIDPDPSPAIDHLLVGPGLAVTRFHILAAHSGGRLASDHFPVIADMQLKAGPCTSGRNR